MERDEIIENLGKLFDVEDSSELDASDFKDRAGIIFDLYSAAKALLEV